MFNKIRIGSIITCFVFVILMIVNTIMFDMKNIILLIIEIIVLIVNMFLTGFIAGYMHKSKK